MLITEDVHIIEGVKGANVFFVDCAEPFLVDTGLPGQEKKIFDYIMKIGKSKILKGIILTHYDVDHVGSAFALKNLFKCPIYAHPFEIPYISNKLARPGIKKILPKLTRPIYGPLVPLTNIEPIEKDFFCAWKVIHTPGHTPGHLVLYKDKIAIVGDLFQGGKIRLAPPYFTWNSNELKKSVANLVDKPIKWILPGHGPVTSESVGWLDNFKNN